MSFFPLRKIGNTLSRREGRCLPHTWLTFRISFDSLDYTAFYFVLILNSLLHFLLTVTNSTLTWGVPSFQVWRQRTAPQWPHPSEYVVSQVAQSGVFVWGLQRGGDYFGSPGTPFLVPALQRSQTQFRLQEYQTSHCLQVPSAGQSCPLK